MPCNQLTLNNKKINTQPYNDTYWNPTPMATTPHWPIDTELRKAGLRTSVSSGALHTSCDQSPSTSAGALPSDGQPRHTSTPITNKSSPPKTLKSPRSPTSGGNDNPSFDYCTIRVVESTIVYTLDYKEQEIGSSFNNFPCFLLKRLDFV